MKKSRRKIAAVIISVVAVIAVVSGSLAWYTSTNSLQQNGRLFGFSSSARVYFKLNDGTEYSASADKDGLYKLSLNSNDKNYIGNLRINVMQKGRSNCYTRVKMNVEWALPDGTVTQNIMLPFKFAEKWYDNRSNDYCVYCKEASNLSNDFDKSIIIGFDESEFISSNLVESATPRLAVSVESVQINRYQQLWGIDRLPWSGSSEG